MEPRPGACRAHALVAFAVITHLAPFSSSIADRPCDPTWSLTALSARAEHALAYDEARGVTVMFGGAIGSPSAETWEWDGTTWLLRSISGPAPRSGHALAYDSRRGVVVLFGGATNTEDGFKYVVDTWEWDGTTWTLMASDGPDPRQGCGLVYDVARSETVLFGGDYYDANFRWTLYSDTWSWDGAKWTRLSETGPTGRRNAAMAYDDARERVVLFGGQIGNHDSPDTWEWDGNSWQQRSSTGPPRRANAALVFDSMRGVSFLYGGSDTNSGTYRLEPWEWDGTNWRQLAAGGPGPRKGHAMAYDRGRGVTVFFGGLYFGDDDLTYYADTWEWNGQNWSDRGTEAPNLRESASLAYDDRRDVIVLFGGRSGFNGEGLGDTWELSADRWRLRATEGPPGRSNAPMAFDRNRGVTVLFGGASDARTWEWNGEVWTDRAVQGPPARDGNGLVYDDSRGVCWMFGGFRKNKRLNDLWKWDGKTWTEVVTRDAPTTYVGSMAYDADRHVIVLITGDDALQLWECNGERWTQRSYKEGPFDLRSPEVVHDRARRVNVIWGNDYPENRTWEWDGNNWRVAAHGGPLRRDGFSMTYDERRYRTVLFGGSSSGTMGDTWAFGGPAVAGDCNCDGAIDFADIDFFVTGLSNDVDGYGRLGGSPECWENRLCWGDANHDDSVDFGDIDAFVERLGE